MIHTRFHNALIMAFGGLLLLLTSCGDVVVRVEDVPSNTPAGAPIYITGNFNYWDPGDSRYQLQRGSDSSYYVILPKGWGQVEYKFTRGDWTTVEANDCGYEIPNRLFEYLTADTVIQHIQSWSDLNPVNCPEITLVLKDLPENTPDSATINMAANLNGWRPKANEYKFEVTEEGDRVLKIPKPADYEELEFKVTRGNLNQAEGDEFGNAILNRVVQFGTQDTVILKVESWEDLTESKNKQVTIILDRVPANTPADAAIFLAGDFNNWYPRDQAYRCQLTKDGKYAVQIPRKGNRVSFKFTRGDWSNTEVDFWGNDQENYDFEFGTADTLHTFVENWADLTTKGDHYTLIVDRIPTETPENSNLYVAGNFNDWNPLDRKYKLVPNSRNKWSIGIPAKNRKIEYKFTRGGWPRVEGDKVGKMSDNRAWSKRKGMVAHNTIWSWEDIFKVRYNKVTVLVRNLPENTPAGSKLYVPCNYNGWQAADPRYKMKQLSDGTYALTIKRKGDQLDFKITRGGWKTVEVNGRGEEIQNRRFQFGTTDTVVVDVVKWKDNP